MSVATSYRGQPLVALMVMLGGWVTVRALLLGAAPAAPDSPAVPMLADRQGRARPVAARRADLGDPGVSGAPALLRAVRAPLMPRSHAASAKWLIAARTIPIPPASTPTAGVPQVPSLMAQSSAPGQEAGPARAEASDRASRWSADGWLLLRRGGQALSAGGLAAPIYGASQLGAVVRYRLDPGSAHRPALYLRGSAALDGSREREAAFGVSARPIAGLPLAVAAEGRINDQPGSTHARPAAFAYTEMPPVNLPLGMRAELYGQAGYVGGDFATAFADGQVRIDRGVAGLGRGELRAGGGVWGGAQRGASRLDLGPSVTLGLPLGGSAGARLAFDWRFRVAGNAGPASGPALTLSAGF